MEQLHSIYVKVQPIFICLSIENVQDILESSNALLIILEQGKLHFKCNLKQNLMLYQNEHNLLNNKASITKSVRKKYIRKHQ